MTEQRIAEVLAELTDPLASGVVVVDFLQTLAERCVELLQVTASGVVLADDSGRPHVVAGTSDVTRDLERFELDRRDGPCLETLTDGNPVHDVDLSDAARRWPQFAAAAAAVGIRRTSALPLRSRGRVIGVLSLFSDREVPMAPAALALGRAMADIASVGLRDEPSWRTRRLLSEELQHALESRVVVERAKGLLAVQAHIGLEEADTWLRNHARSTGTPLTSIARAVLEDGLRLADGVAAPQREAAQVSHASTSDETSLTPHDLQTLRLLVAGAAGTEVAAQLGVSASEVAGRLTAVRRVLQVGSTAAAIDVLRTRGVL